MAPSRRPTWELLVHYLAPQRRKVAALSALLLSSIGLQLLNPQLLRAFIDAATAGGAPRTLLALALAFIAAALVTQMLSVGATYLSEQVGWIATNAMRADLSLHCLGLDLAFHKERTPGEMIERIDGDVTALSNFFSQFVVRIVGSLLLMVGVLVLLFLEDWRVGLALMIFALAAGVVINRTRNIAVPHIQAERAASAALVGFFEERLAGIDDIRANGAGRYAVRGFHQVLYDFYRKARRAMRFGMSTWTVSNGLFALGYVLALAMGAYLYNAGSVTIGTVYLFFQYTDMLRRPLEMLAEQLRDFQKATASIGRVRELYGFTPQIVSTGAAPLPAGPLAVDFERVTFSYADDEQPVLRDVSLSLAPGTVLGLLGRTGSGKTTLTRLLFRLYDPQSGAVRVAGTPIRDVALPTLRRHIGIVTQDVQLFQASVRDNLAFFDTAIGDERILAVLDELELGDWVRALPHGLDTELAPGGGGLSAGEAQLLAFARIFLEDPGVVILDEASSRLDPATERLIERGVSKLLRGRTGIVIAHRLDTVQRADEIVILEQGRILEHGPRAELAADPESRFAQLLATGISEVLA